MTKFKLIPAGLLFSAVALGGTVNAIDIELGNGMKGSVEVEATAYAKVIPGYWIYTQTGDSVTGDDGIPPFADVTDGKSKADLESAFKAHINNVPYLNLPWRVRTKISLEKDLSAEVMPGFSAKASVKFKNKDTSSGEFAIKTAPTLALTFGPVGTFTFGPGIDNAYDSISFWLTDGNGPHHLVSEDMVGSTSWFSNVSLDGGLGVNWVGSFVGDLLTVAVTAVPYVTADTTEIVAGTKGVYSFAVSYSQEFGPVSVGVGIGAGMDMVYSKETAEKALDVFFKERVKVAAFNAKASYMLHDIGKFNFGIEYVAGNKGTKDADEQFTIEHNVKMEFFWTSFDEKWSAGANAAFTIIPKTGEAGKNWETEKTVEWKPAGDEFKYFGPKHPYSVQVDLSASYKFSTALLGFFGVRLVHNTGVGDLMSVNKTTAEITNFGPITWSGGLYGGVKYTI